MGYREYEDLSREYRVPIVVGGFEPLDLLEAIRMLVAQLEEGRAEVGESILPLGHSRRHLAGPTRRSRRSSRSPAAPGAASASFPQGGLRLREDYAALDAERVFDVADTHKPEPPECISALVLQGLKKPPDCPAFGAALHARVPARRADGLERRRLRRLLSATSGRSVEVAGCQHDHLPRAAACQGPHPARPRQRRTALAPS